MAATVCMVFLILVTPVNTRAAVTDSGTFGNLKWELDQGTLTVTGTGEMGTGVPWNGYKNQITHVVIGEGITNLSTESFDSCTALTDISLPDSLEKIDMYAFYGCSSLKAITIPKNVTYVGAMVFSGCKETVITFLSWNCELNYGFMPNDSGISLRGYSNSTAEAYAKEYSGENKIPFEQIVCSRHNYVDTINSIADCTHTGKITRICSECGDRQVETVAASGHLFSDWYTVKEPTCTTNGEKERRCTREGCDYREADVIPAKGHQYEVVEKTDSTCETIGYTKYTCTVCGDTYEEKSEGFSHQYDEGVVDKVPSEKENGRMKYTCLYCGQVHYKTIASIKAPDKVILDSAETAQTIQLKVSYPGGGKVFYYSYDPDIKVNQNGVVTIPKRYSGQANILVSVDATDSYESMGASILLVVNKISPNLSVSNVRKTASSLKDQKFALNVKRRGDGKLTYQSFHPKIKVDAKGNVTIAKNFVGTGYLVVRTQESKYYQAGLKKIAIQVSPEQTALSGLQNIKGKKLKLTWKTKSSATGYEIQYSTNSKFKTTKTIVQKGYRKGSATVSGLSKNKTYYVRIRIVRRTAGADVYSSWSASKKIKIIK